MDEATVDCVALALSKRRGSDVVWEEDRHVAVDAIAAYEEAQWQTMDNAPRDREPVLLWSELWELSWGVQVGFFEDGQWHCGEGSVDDGSDTGPVFWAHIPRTHNLVDAGATPSDEDKTC